jgi:hypothetical protein
MLHIYIIYNIGVYIIYIYYIDYICILYAYMSGDTLPSRITSKVSKVCTQSLLKDPRELDYRFCCFTAALLLIYRCFAAALLLLYCFFTAALLTLYWTIDSRVFVDESLSEPVPFSCASCKPFSRGSQGGRRRGRAK